MANRGQETRKEFLHKLILVGRTLKPQEEVVLAKKEKKKNLKNLPRVGWKGVRRDELEEIILRLRGRVLRSRWVGGRRLRRGWIRGRIGSE